MSWSFSFQLIFYEILSILCYQGFHILLKADSFGFLLIYKELKLLYRIYHAPDGQSCRGGVDHDHIGRYEEGKSEGQECERYAHHNRIYPLGFAKLLLIEQHYQRYDEERPAIKRGERRDTEYGNETESPCFPLLVPSYEC